MKVLNLGCANRHVFEGWFASEEDFCQQLEHGLIECPLCSDRSIEKKLSAPRLNLGATQTTEQTVPDRMSGLTTASQDGMPSSEPHMTVDQQTAFIQAMREVLRQTEDVGESFASEARRMHYGETEKRNIRGRTDWSEAVAMAEEGIDLLPLPDLDILKNTVQ